MSSDSGPNGGGPGGEQSSRPRRSSITQAAMSNLFQRGNSTAGAPSASNDAQRRRLSVTTIGLSAAQQNAPPTFNLRRGSMSTNSNSDSIDESAIEDEEGQPGARTAPTTPFTRRMSFGNTTIRGMRTGGSPGNGNDPTSPPPPPLGRRPSGHKSPSNAGSSISAALQAAGRRPSVLSSSLPQASNFKNPRAPSDNVSSRTDQQGYNWSEQLRSRAESSVSGARPSFSLASSPPRGSVQHDRAKSVSDMPQPPVQAATVKPQPERRKPDAFQERILKGDFYMD